MCDPEEDRLMQFLKTNKANSPFFPHEHSHKLVTVRQESTIGEAFKQMIEHRVLSVVVVNADHKPICTLGLLHIISFMLRTFREEDFGSDFYLKITDWVNNSPHLERAKKFHKTPLEKALKKINLDSDPIYCVQEDTSLLEVYQMMTEKNAHRIIVCDKENKAVSLITQSRMISLINVLDLPKTYKTLEELEMARKDVICIPNTETAYTAFQWMVKHKVNGLAVVNADGEIVGNISISDVKLIGWDADYWNLLGFPVKEYLLQLANHPESIIRDYNFWTIDRPQTVVLKSKPNETLQNVVRMMCFFRVHRIYVVGDNKKPIGVVSMQDVLRKLLSSSNTVSAC